MDDPESPEGRVKLFPKEFVQQVGEFSLIGLRERAATFLFVVYGCLIVVTLGIFVLQGFHFRGFDLQCGLLNWLGGAALGEVAGLAVMVYGFLFKKP